MESVQGVDISWMTTHSSSKAAISWLTAKLMAFQHFLEILLFSSNEQYANDHATITATHNLLIHGINHTSWAPFA
ncbi:hypothetical protein M7I_0179 [Glarea lozoyensis 74030]|uniref:Uncharacterized protein n=1 Tax=Glarea lozoyensis (strain ATCC 74030 / MF5533) TaxID=1104152 RepID=H0ECN5_GLAL7|nr:hypothetical protein M7I_0179 [Glarea lozoyensis 74030]